MQNIKEINTDSVDGQMLMAAIAILTTELWTDATPEQALARILELRNKMYPRLEGTLPPTPPTFKRMLAELINRFSRENESNTPDFILADYMEESLAIFEKTSRMREKWYGKELNITGS